MASDAHSREEHIVVLRSSERPTACESRGPRCGPGGEKLAAGTRREARTLGTRWTQVAPSQTSGGVWAQLPVSGGAGGGGAAALAVASRAAGSSSIRFVSRVFAPAAAVSGLKLNSRTPDCPAATGTYDAAMVSIEVAVGGQT